MRCTHLSRLGTQCIRQQGHDGAHIAGFTDPPTDPRQHTIYDALEAMT